MTGLPVVLICGDRDWTDRARIRGVLWRLRATFPEAVIRHGANGYDEAGAPSFTSGKPTVRGADMIAHEEARALGLAVDPRPADWKAHGKAAGPIRNAAMLAAEPRPFLVIAFHDNLFASKGTRDMVLKAESANTPWFVRHSFAAMRGESTPKCVRSSSAESEP